MKILIFNIKIDLTVQKDFIYFSHNGKSILNITQNFKKLKFTAIQ